MSHSTRSTLALSAALVSGLALSTSAFAMTDLAAGYMLGGEHAHDAAKGGKPGHTVTNMDTDKNGEISKVEFAAAHGGDTSRFSKYDTDKNGSITRAELDAGHAAKAGAKAMEGKCGEGKCGAAKAAAAKPVKAAEGKCGEGKCGATKAADVKPVKAAEGKCGEGKCGEGKCGGAA